MVYGKAFSQGPTGINTISPQQALQISGTPSTSTQIGTIGKYVVTPTLRVEGLNATNNSVHPADPANPSFSTQPVYATSTGDLVIGRKYTVIKQTLPGIDAIAPGSSNGILFDVPSNSGLITAPSPLYTTTFTLAQPSLVYFSAIVSFSFLGAAEPTPMNDGKARMGGLQFQFSSVPTSSNIPTAYFASNTMPFTQPAVSGSASVANGFSYLSLSKVVKLPAGQYTFNILGCAQSTGTTSSFHLYFGRDPHDMINITAIAL